MEKYRLRVSENRLLRRIFEPRRAEVTGGRRKLQNVEFHNLYSLSKIRVVKSRMRRAGHVACMRKQLPVCPQI
jgi:hypothetical protein